MSKDCNIVRDLYPLVDEKIASHESVEFVGKHLEECSECQEEYKKVKGEKIAVANEGIVDDNAVLSRISTGIKRDKKRDLLIRSFLILAIVASLYGFLTRAENLNYDQSISSVELEDERLVINLKDEVSLYDIYESNGGENGEYSEGVKVYYLTTFKHSLGSIIGNTFYNKSIVIDDFKKGSSAIFQEFYGNSRSLAGSNLGENSIVLPRLVLKYYLFIAMIGLVLLAVVYFVFERLLKKKIANFVVGLLLYDLSYVIGSIIVGTVTHKLIFDFIKIIAITVFLGSFLILLRNKWIEKRMYKDVIEN